VCFWLPGVSPHPHPHTHMFTISCQASVSLRERKRGCHHSPVMHSHQCMPMLSYTLHLGDRNCVTFEVTDLCNGFMWLWGYQHLDGNGSYGQFSVERTGDFLHTPKIVQNNWRFDNHAERHQQEACNTKQFGWNVHGEENTFIILNVLFWNPDVVLIRLENMERKQYGGWENDDEPWHVNKYLNGPSQQLILQVKI
jgi:hypothetical protein